MWSPVTTTPASPDPDPATATVHGVACACGFGGFEVKPHRIVELYGLSQKSRPKPQSRTMHGDWQWPDAEWRWPAGQGLASWRGLALFIGCIAAPDSACITGGPPAV